MTKEMMIEILKEDRCTQAEAERFIKSGTIIFEEIFEDAGDFLDFINKFKEEYEERYTLDDVKNGYVADTSCVIYNDKEYYIVYVN